MVMSRDLHCPPGRGETGVWWKEIVMLPITLFSQQRTFWSKLKSLKMGEGGGRVYKGALPWERGHFPQRCRMRELEETGEVWFLLPETRN